MSRYNPILQGEYLFVKKIEDFDHVKKADEQAEKKARKKILVVAAGDKIFALDGKRAIKISERDNEVMALCPHEGKLYDSSFGVIYETLSNKRVTERKYQIRAFCSHDGKLYDGGGDGVYETFTGKLIWRFNSSVTTMISVDREAVGL